MFCNNCGTPIAEGEIFCTKCGARVESVGETQQFAQETVVSAEESVNPTVPPVKKKGKIGKILGITGITILVVAIATAIGAFASQGFRNFLFKTVMPPENYLEYVVGETAKDFSKDFSEEVTNVKNISVGAHQGVNGEVKCVIGDGLYDFVSANGGHEAVSMLRWINNISAEYDVATNGNKVSADINCKLNGTDITSVEYAADLDNGHLYFTLPDISTSSARVSFGGDETEMLAAVQELAGSVEEVINILPDEKTTERIVTKYAKDMVKAIDEVQRKSDDLEIEGVKQKVTVLTAEIDGNVLEDAAENILKDLKKDKDIEKIINDFADTSIGDSVGMTGDELYDEFIDGIDYLLDDVDEVGEMEGSADIDFYVDGSGKIIGIGTEVSNVEILIASIKKGDEFAATLQIKADMGAVEIAGKGTRKGSEETAKYVVRAMGQEIVTVDYTVDTDKLKEGVCVGNITIKPGSTVSTLLMNEVPTEVASLISGAELKIEATETSADISLDSNGKMFVAINATFNTNNNTNVKLPSSYIDVTDHYGMESWTGSFDPEVAAATIISRLSAAGMPAELVSEIMPVESEDVGDAETSSVTTFR